MTTATRAAIYARVSLDVTGEGLAVERQQDACRSLAKSRGWTVLDVIVDNSISAYSRAKRPGFDRLKAMIEQGDIDIIIAWHVDRLVRSLVDLEHLISLAEDHHVVIATVTGDFDLATDTGRMIARILASVARGEVERKSARQRAANAQAAKAGKRRGGRRPFGYEADGVTIREPEADAVRRGFADVLAGVPLGAIARQWNVEGLRTGQWTRDTRASSKTEGQAGEPSKWRHDSVRHVLTNPRYAGLRSYNGDIMATAAEWPAVVDEATFRAAGAILADPARRTSPTSSAKALLTGIGQCGVCADETTVHSGGGRSGIRNIRCIAHNHLNRAAIPVEDYVGRVIVERLSRPGARALLLKRGGAADVDAAHDEGLAIRSRLDMLASDFADGTLTASQLRTATERLRGRLAELDAALADAGRVDVLGPLIGSGDVAGAWLAMSVARRRTVVSQMADVVVFPPGRGVRNFNPASVSVDWRL